MHPQQPIGTNEFAPYYSSYIQQAGSDIFEELGSQLELFPAFLKAIPESKMDYSYLPGKWTIKEVIGHITDTERIMAYRALRIARNDKTPLAGFNQEGYVLESRSYSKNLDFLIEEFTLVRKSNLFLFKSFDELELLRMGTASGYDVSVRALLYIISGHLKHHKQILIERYLKEPDILK